MVGIEALNQEWFLHVNAGGRTPGWLIHAAMVIANDFICLIPLALVWMWLRGDARRRNVALRACAVALLGVGINQIIGMLWPHPRPFVLGLGHAYLAHTPDSSFPSDHGTLFAGTGLTLLLGSEPGLALLTLATGLSVAWARVFLGVHFPLDMVGAVLVASVAFLLLLPVWKIAGAPLTDQVQRLYRRALAWPITRGWLRG